MEEQFLEQDQSKKLYSSDFLSFYILNESDIAVCQAETEYIPIEHFRNDFNAIGDLIKKNDVRALVFDKRNLSTFHQPSMEWYYTEWKEDLLEHGMHTHYKILPEAPWFAKSVEAGKHDIKKNHPNFKFDQFDVNYVVSIQEAVDHWKKAR